MKKEKWALLKEFGNEYKISNLGVLYSIKRSKALKLRVSKKYLCCGICYKGVSKTVRIHRLVAIHFLPNPHNKPYVNHLDGDTLNNMVSNLEWATHLENTVHAIRKRLTRKPGGNDKTLTEKQVLDIFKSEKPAMFFVKKYGVCRHTINMIRNGKKWGWFTGKEYRPKDGNRKYIEYMGEKITHTQLAHIIGATPATITYRISKGWSVDKIIANTPKKKSVVRWIPNQKQSVYI